MPTVPGHRPGHQRLGPHRQKNRFPHEPGDGRAPAEVPTVQPREQSIGGTPHQKADGGSCRCPPRQLTGSDGSGRDGDRRREQPLTNENSRQIFPAATQPADMSSPHIGNALVKDGLSDSDIAQGYPKSGNLEVPRQRGILAAIGAGRQQPPRRLQASTLDQDGLSQRPGNAEKVPGQVEACKLTVHEGELEITAEVRRSNADRGRRHEADIVVQLLTEVGDMVTVDQHVVVGEQQQFVPRLPGSRRHGVDLGVGTGLIPRRHDMDPRIPIGPQQPCREIPPLIGPIHAQDDLVVGLVQFEERAHRLGPITRRARRVESTRGHDDRNWPISIMGPGDLPRLPALPGLQESTGHCAQEPHQRRAPKDSARNQERLAHAHVRIEIDIGISPLFVLDSITKYNSFRSGVSQHEPSGRFIIMIATLTLVLSVYLAALALGDIYLLLAHMRHRLRSVELERADSVHAVVPPERLPTVCVQLAVYNEPTVIARAIDSLCALDWPPDRLEILVLDDSSDETSAIADQKVDDWARRGSNVRILRRADRTGFKAGALQAALHATEAAYIAIFDVDYRPEPSFLQRSMKPLMADPRLAFVQARLDYRNRNQNWLTRAQGLGLDTHFAYEQAARNWAGIPMMFNGTCGIWRRAAIRDAGGWSSRSLGEDQDLSFRAFAKGWRCRYLLTVSVEGELPHLLADLVSQRRRWSTAATQNLRVLPLRLRHHLNWHQTVAFLLLSQFNSAASILLIATAIGALASSILEPQSLGLSAAALLAVLLLIIVVKTAGSALARKALGGSLDARYWGDVLLMWALDATLLPVNGMSFISGLLGRHGDFVRTPKAGI